ncbi:MAG: hypothetical protein FWF69_02175 [Firmicutes bacterium]|nr:hypothetical protein [Bacillota bacterium]
MWMVIHMAKSKTLALSVCEQLEREGFLVKLSPVYRGISDEDNYFELMVPESEAAEARQVLLDRGLC